MTGKDLTARLREAERRAQELRANASGLLAQVGAIPGAPVASGGPGGPGGLGADSARRLVEAHFDESGLLARLIYTGERSVHSYALQGEILLSLAGGGFPIADGPERLIALADAMLGDAPREAVRANERRTAAVTAREGLVVRVAFDHGALRGARSQTLCDEVVPLARAAAVASDSVGRFDGSVR